jgi:hypothetical protein
MMRKLWMILVVLATWPAHAEPLPHLRPRDGSCPHGYSASGSFCVPREGAQDAVRVPSSGSCPFGWTRSASFCLRSGR